jgi:acyl-CoA reductase-like NAD-dependent aldehyde dehydrogenase
MAQATLRAKKPVAKSIAPRIGQTKLLINNRWVEPAEGNYFETLNPATGKPIAKVAEGTAADIDKAVKAARTALEHPSWKKRSPGDRGRLL